MGGPDLYGLGGPDSGTFLSFRQRIGSTALLSDFDSMFRRQKDIPAEEFNEDHAYKNILNEVSRIDPGGSGLETLF